ncbi:tRNA1Val (adenine37-N6)-methyltransferase [Aureibacter tunicatorum]|uniref:tRNA1Val (Adenine37-N6)-methyltransferase n=2 Tax=Aureibacter tunicatorum TaxID=866807 RepID=A0AAE4BSP0_9BACT|nr:tRNA1Val (adenine37-N6)-methyltransferase [Aureibacter tunicatorum]
MKVTQDACAFGALVNRDIDPYSILDIGTGTGLLALMMAQKFENSLIDAIEINNEAYLQAVENVKNSEWNDRIKLIKTRVQDYAHSVKDSYQMVVANPPFFSQSLKSLNSNRREAFHDDSLSMEELAEAVQLVLADNGVFWLMMPPNEMDKSVDLNARKGLYLKEVIHVSHNMNKKEHMRFCSFSKHDLNRVIEDRVLIYRNLDNKWTESFNQLMEPYYL